MKNNSILNIYQFLDKIDISKLEDTNLVCKVLYNLSKLDGENSKIKKRFESVQSKLFKDKTDRVSELSELRKTINSENEAEISKKIKQEYRDILDLEQIYYKIVNSILDEHIDIDLDKIDRKEISYICKILGIDLSLQEFIELRDLIK